MTLTSLPNSERDEIVAAMESLKRIMPAQAETARCLYDELVDKGFTEDQALQLVAHALFSAG